MTGLFRKIFIEVRWSVLLFGIGLAAIMALLTALLPRVLGDAEQMLDRLPFIRPLLTALLGTDVTTGFTAQMMQAFLWVHPTVLALIWAFEITWCTRMPAAEIDRGSIDFLLGLPVSRWQVYLAETTGFLASGVILLAIGCSGHWLCSGLLQPNMRPGRQATVFVLFNLYSVYAAVGGISFFVSACSDRRGRAVGVIFALLLVTFLLNFLAQFWPPAQTISFLSIMQYYRPAAVIQTGEFPCLNAAVLWGVAVCTWVLGGRIFRSRSICTV